ncbi:hypothetical protein B0T36_01650 [Nocardia donostiensis]|nr:hypothetical protein B0T36_01650 [Nocardia donostiensis]
MTDSSAGGGESTARRPRDRRLRVAREAAEMFAAHGFAAVRMDDIARAVGVTARALYRHYPSKHDLLLAVALASQDGYYTAFEAADAVETPHDRFLAAITALVQVTLDERSHAVLWQREARHLRREDRAAVRGRLTAIAHRLAELIGRYRDQPADDPTVELLAWAVLSVVTSPGHHTRTLPRPEADRLLIEVADTLAQLKLPPPLAGTVRVTARHLTSRRERILAESARLFGERGYPAVSVEDIGEAVGILGPSVYHYFPGKQHILGTLINRMYEWVTFGLITAGEESEPSQAVARMTGFYVSLALRFPDLAGIAVTEVLYLGESEAESLRRVRSELVAEWAGMLAAARPDLPIPTANQFVEIVIALTGNLARTPHLHSSDVVDRITALAEAVYTTALPIP